jgi:prophage maintenance system killer protein
LGLNGYTFKATDDDVVAKTLALAAREISEVDLATWIRAHSQPRT